MLETLGLSTVVVAAAEIGDKTQLLSIFLAARFRAPKPIIWGILLATIFNHALAGALGASLSSFISEELLRWILIVSFLAMAVWILIPDKMEDDDYKKKAQRFGVFGTTLLLFFLAEMGDKTQIATIAMSARYASEAVWDHGDDARDDDRERARRLSRRKDRREDFNGVDAPHRGGGLRDPRGPHIFRLKEGLFAFQAKNPDHTVMRGGRIFGRLFVICGLLDASVRSRRSRRAPIRPCGRILRRGG